jgi:hypothetical protein
MKLTDDILKSNGKYSRKSIAVALSFLAAITIGAFIVVSDLFLHQEVNRYSIEVFQSLLLFTATLLGIAEGGKKFINKNNTESDA